MEDKLLGTAELAALWHVTRRRAQAHVRHLHERSNGQIGQRIGSVWVLSAEDAARLQPGKAGRPKRQSPAEA